MGDPEDFQERHGPDWARIVEEPAFAGAMRVLSIDKINYISRLTDTEIATHAPIILSDLRGHLNHEINLMLLSARKEFKFGTPIEESYPDPAVEAVEQAERDGITSQPRQITPRKKRK